MAESGQSSEAWMCRLCYEDNAANADVCTACQAPKAVCGWLNEPKLYDSTGDYEDLDGIEEADHEKVKKIIKKIRTIREECSKSGSDYTDKTFRGHSAIKSPTVGHLVQRPVPAYKWLKPTEMDPSFKESPEPWTLFNAPKPSDPMQRSLGDCWLISGMQVLALRPNLLKRNFITKRYNKEGIYGVRLFKNGQWINTIIDDRFPCSARGFPVFSWCHRNQLWVALLEKAIAKCHHSYLDLIGGWAITAFTLLTGYGSLFMYTMPDCINSIFEYVSKTKEKGIIHMTGITNKLDEEEYTQVGLASHHSYGILDVKTLSDGRRLLLIRDPTGKIEYTGDWGEWSNNWLSVPQEEIPAIGRGKKGMFWMSVKDFGRYFEDVTALHIRESWTCTRTVVSLPVADAESLYQGIAFEVEETLSIDIFTVQLYPHNRTHGDHAGILVIVKEDGSIFNCTDGQAINNQFINILLIPGKYRVFFWTFSAWLNNADEHVSLITYSSKPVRVNLCKEPKDEFIYQILTFIVAKGEAEHQVDADRLMTIYTVKSPDWLGVMVAAVNMHPTNSCEYSLHFACRDSFVTPREEFTTTEVFPPLHGQILNILTLDFNAPLRGMDELEIYSQYGQDASPGRPEYHRPPLTPKTEALFKAVPCDRFFKES